MHSNNCPQKRRCQAIKTCSLGSPFHTYYSLYSSNWAIKNVTIKPLAEPVLCSQHACTLCLSSRKNFYPKTVHFIMCTKKLNCTWGCHPISPKRGKTSAILADVCKKPIGYLALVVETVGHQTTTTYSYHTIYFECRCQCELSECRNLTISMDGSFIPWFIISWPPEITAKNIKQAHPK